MQLGISVVVHMNKVNRFRETEYLKLQCNNNNINSTKAITITVLTSTATYITLTNNFKYPRLNNNK